VRKVTHTRKRNPLSDLDKILQAARAPDAIIYANFGDDRLRGLGVEGDQILPFPIGLRCYNTYNTCYNTCPYNTLTLPRECVTSVHDRQRQTQMEML